MSRPPPDSELTLQAAQNAYEMEIALLNQVFGYGDK